MQQDTDQSTTSWFIMEPKRTILALVIFVVAVGLLLNLLRLKHLDPNRNDPTWGVAVLGIFAIMSFWAMTRGGATLDVMNRRITRWWGPFFPVWSRHIDFDSIQSVAVAPGMRPGSIQAARPEDYSYHIAVETEQDTIVLRWTKSQDAAQQLAQLISAAVSCPVEGQVP